MLLQRTYETVIVTKRVASNGRNILYRYISFLHNCARVLPSGSLIYDLIDVHPHLLEAIFERRRVDCDAPANLEK